MNNVNDSNRWLSPLYISLGSFLVALASFYFSYFGLPGKVTLGKPAGYAIIRGEINDYINKYSGPCDHLILPLEWHNTNRHSVAITDCKIIITEVDRYGREKERNGENYKYLLAGEYIGISDKILKREYMVSNSFILPANTIIKNILLFHNDKWYCKNSPLYTHKFELNKIYKVTIYFYQNGNEDNPIILFQKMPILEWREASGRSWEFWYRENDW